MQDEIIEIREGDEPDTPNVWVWKTDGTPLGRQLDAIRKKALEEQALKDSLPARLDEAIETTRSVLAEWKKQQRRDPSSGFARGNVVAYTDMLNTLNNLRRQS